MMRHRIINAIERWTGLPLTEDAARIVAAARFRRHVDNLAAAVQRRADREAALMEAFGDENWEQEEGPRG